jgi:hypothetical protein
MYTFSILVLTIVIQVLLYRGSGRRETGTGQQQQPTFAACG